MNLELSLLLIFAQTPENVADKAATEILTKITTFKLAGAVGTVLVTYLLIELVSRLLFWLSERVAKERRLKIKQFVPFLRMLILSIALLVLMNQLLNLSKENVFAITSTVAVALGFAFKDYVNSVIAGVLGLFEAPYQIGDRIQIEDHYGEVVTYGLRGLRLKTPTDDIVSIPHNKLWTQAIANANMGNLEAQIVTHFYLDHSADPQQVESLLYRVAQTSRYTQLQLPIEVVIEEKLWGTLFKLKCYPIDARHEFKYKTDLTIRAKQKFKEYDFSYPTVSGLMSPSGDFA